MDSVFENHSSDCSENAEDDFHESPLNQTTTTKLNDFAPYSCLQ